MKGSLAISFLVVACVSVENNVPAGGTGGVFSGGANDGTGNPATCHAACQNATAKCGPLSSTSGEPLSVDQCASQCVQAAPPTTMISCVSTAPTCDAIFACDDPMSTPTPQPMMGTCRTSCQRVEYLCGPLRDEEGNVMTLDECTAKCMSSGAPQAALDCMTNAQTCGGIQSCAGA